MTRTPSPCGTTGGYSAHRRRNEPTCQPCRDAAAAYEHRRSVRRYVTGESRMVDATGTRRRIRALMRLGWSLTELAARVGTDKQTLCRLHQRAPRVRRSTAVKVSAVFDDLSMIPGPSVRARMFAERRGWPPPLAWDDDSIDDPAARPAHRLRSVAAHRPRDEDAEARALELTRAGLSAAEIALRLRVSTRFVQRARARHRTDGAA